MAGFNVESIRNQISETQRLKQCSPHHYQIIDAKTKKVAVDIWPTKRKFYARGETETAVVGTEEQLLIVADRFVNVTTKPEGPTAYEFTFSANLANVLPGLNEINETIKEFGFSEQISIRGPFQKAVLSGVRVLSAAEQKDVGELMASKLREVLPKYEWQLFDCKEIGASYVQRKD